MKFLLFCTTLLWPQLALGGETGSDVDPVGNVALALVIILIVAKLGGDLAVRLGQPAVLGELIGGILVGALPLLGFSSLERPKTDPHIDVLARIGVLILLFEVGLESTVGQMLKVGYSSLLWRHWAWLRPSLSGGGWAHGCCRSKLPMCMRSSAPH